MQNCGSVTKNTTHSFTTGLFFVEGPCFPHLEEQTPLIAPEEVIYTYLSSVSVLFLSLGVLGTKA